MIRLVINIYKFYSHLYSIYDYTCEKGIIVVIFYLNWFLEKAFSKDLLIFISRPLQTQ